MQFIIIGLTVIVMALVGYLYFGRNAETVQIESSSNTQIIEETPLPVSQGIPSQPTQVPAVTSPTTRYKDGTYTKKGFYTSPAGSEEVTISLTLKDDVIVAATFKGEATNPASINNQRKFASGFEAAVVGKSVDGVVVTVVNGASLTGKGFMDALAKIKSEARI